MFKVYWTSKHGQIGSTDFLTLIPALEWTESQRESGHRFVTMVSEDPNVVGKPGADSIVDGILPSGDKYEYTKRR